MLQIKVRIQFSRDGGKSQVIVPRLVVLAVVSLVVEDQVSYIFHLFHLLLRNRTIVIIDIIKLLERTLTEYCIKLFDR